MCIKIQISALHFSHLFLYFCVKDVNIVERKEKQTKQMASKAIKQLPDELQPLHGDKKTRGELAERLAFAVRKTVKCIVDGTQPTVDTVKEMIDINRLALKHAEVYNTEESRQQYAAAVLRACEHAR